MQNQSPKKHQFPAMPSRNALWHIKAVKPYLYVETFPWQLLFSGFLRYSEIAQLKIRDVTIFDSHLSLTIRKSKTDQYRKGNEVVIDRSNKVTCPVHNLERHMRVASINLDHSTHYLFRPIVHAQTGGKLITQNKPLSYSRARESIIGRLHYDWRRYLAAFISLGWCHQGGQCQSSRPTLEATW